MLDSHDVNSLEELYFALNQEEPGEVDDFHHTGRWPVRFNLNNQEDKKLYDLFKNTSGGYTERERAFLVYIFVKNYIVRENPEEYYKNASTRLWQQLVNLFFEDKENSYFEDFVERVLEPYILIRSEREKKRARKTRAKASQKQKELNELFGK